MNIQKIIQTLAGIISVTAEEDKQLQTAIKILQELEDFDVLERRVNVTDAVWSYYVTSRGSGHTNLLKTGIDNYNEPFMIVIASEKQKGMFEDFKCVNYTELEKYAGTGVPLIWDNAAIVKMVGSLSPIQSCFRRIRNILDGSN